MVAGEQRPRGFLEAGEVVCVFPEGQLSETGELQELKPGVALLARRTGAATISLMNPRSDS